MGMLRTALAGLVVLCSSVTAQIDVTEYLPLGAFNTWRAEKRAERARKKKGSP